MPHFLPCFRNAPAFMTALFSLLLFSSIPGSTVRAGSPAAPARAAHPAKHAGVRRAARREAQKLIGQTPFASVRGLQARIEDLEEAAERKKLGEEASGTDFLDSILYFLRQRAYPHDTFDFSAYRRGVAQRDRLAPARIGPKPGLADTFVPSNTWQFVGPNNLGVPYNTYYGNGPLSGRINALAYDPTVADTYYAVAGGGGVWKTTDGGTTWTALSTAWKYQQASCIALDPTNHNTLYVGTGDIAYATYASGIMKSTDGGETWTDLGTSVFGTDGVNALIVDPETPSIITAAAGNRDFGYVYRSTDGGSTWTQAFNQYGIWTDIKDGAKNAGGVRHYYVASAYAGPGTDEELWRSDDRGVTWTQLTIPATGNDYTEGLVVAPSATAPDTVYLMSGNDELLWKSTDAGATWTDITAGLTAAEPGVPGNATYNWSQGGYDIALTCVAGTLNGTPSDTVYDSLIDLARSPDGASTWASLGGPTYNQSGNSVLHNDQHALSVNPSNPNDFLVGCDGGVYHYVFSAGVTTPAITSLNNHLGITQVYKAAYHPTNPNILLAGAQDNGSPICQGDLTTWYNSPSGGDGGGCAINQTNPNDQYSTSQDLTVFHTTDGWNTYTDISPTIPGGEAAPFVGVLTLDPSHPNLLYTGSQSLYQYNATTGVWKYRLGGQYLASGPEILQAISVAPTNGNIIYTGSSDAKVWMTVNQGSTWTEIDSGTTGANTLPGRAITSISINPANPMDVLVGLSGTGGGHLYHCGDTSQGANCVWTNMSGSGASALPDVPLNAVTRDPDSPTATYYVATDIGVFATTDGGMTWTNATLPLGLPNVQVNDLQAVPGTHYLNAATYGRGIWRILLQSPQTAITGFAPASGPVGTSVTITGINFTGATSVKFNGLPAAAFSVVTATSITATVPTGATTGTVSVTAPAGTATSTATFVVAAVPVIVSFTPVSGIAGTAVTLSGTGFMGTTAVMFNGAGTSAFSVVSDTQLTATVPANATTGSITVTNRAGTGTSQSNFTVIIAPAITSFSPASGPVATSVTITGTGFTGASLVKFNGVSATFTVVSDTQITTTVPAGAATGPITVTNAAGTATSITNFTVLVPPVITSFSPTTATVGSVVTINGRGFTGTTEVDITTSVPSYTVVSDTEITATVPLGSLDVYITVTTPLGTATSSTFFHTAPSITGFTPASGGAGTVVTINGWGFNVLTGVTFNGVAASSFSGGPNAPITATVAAGTTTGPISVTTLDGTAVSAGNFTVTAPPAPTITSITPTSGAAGTVVTITGTNLGGATRVTINGVSVAFTLVNSTTIKVTIPAGTTSGAVSVTTPGGTVTSGSTTFTFLTWSAKDVAAATDGTSRLLWTRSDGAAGVWTLNAAGAQSVVGPTYGPYAGWTAKALSVSSDGTTRLLWTNTNGMAGLWTMNTADAQTITGTTYGPYPGWSAADVATASNGISRVLWTNTSGAAGVWTFSAADIETTIGTTYGPYMGWTAKAVGAAGDGTARMLWTNTNGMAGLWTMNASDGQQTVGTTYGPYSGWTASGLGTSSDGTSNVLWTNVSGAAGIWTFSAADVQTHVGTTYGPYSGYTAASSDAASDSARVLWVRSDRAAGVWSFSASDAESVIGTVYGPY